MGLKDILRGLLGKRGDDPDPVEEAAESPLPREAVPQQVLLPEEDPQHLQLLEQLVEEARETRRVYGPGDLKNLSSYGEIKELAPADKVGIVFCASRLLRAAVERMAEKGSCSSADDDYVRRDLYDALISSLMRMRMEFDDDRLISLLSFFRESAAAGNPWLRFTNWPIGHTVIQFEKHVKKDGLSEKMETFLADALSWPEFDQGSPSWGADIQKAKYRLQGLVRHEAGKEGPPPCRLDEKDALGAHANSSIAELDGEFRERIYEMLNLSLTATGGKPTKKFLEASKEVLSRTDDVRYRAFLRDWFSHIISADPVDQYNDSGEYIRGRYLIGGKNVEIVKGLVWSLVRFHDAATIEILADLAERCFRKVPGQGPACMAVGNACFYTLATSRGLGGISHLSRLRLRIGQHSARKLIAKYLEEGAAKRGVSPAELEELSIPEFGLREGVREDDFGGFTTRLTVTGVGKTEMEWITSGGKKQKSVPADVKKSKPLSEKLKKLRNTAKQIQKYTTAQRDRIDRSYVDAREWSYEDFRKYYLEHGLVGPLARRLVWSFESGGGRTAAIWREGRWEDVGGRPVAAVGEDSRVRLWHPLSADENEVLRWRERLEELKIRQPMKQAYREVYILTEAELETRIYSNRMAAHILKQHQFNALAKLRGWKYSLIGTYDGGDEAPARIFLPAHRIGCEYWINEIHGEDAYSDAGIWNYISTDQVRFIDEGGETMNLVDVPELVFSEMMRDVDLFVGVCSVGNDPEWLDRGGAPQYRDYWMNYSFGDLSELARTRKTVLESLLPRLKIRDRVTIDGKFLRVKGTIREYKIHIGSTNVLMEPNDRYLCIVPARGEKGGADKLFLPFEGDRGLSLVLSKAILLAEDDRITDSTILSQIRRKSQG